MKFMLDTNTCIYIIKRKPPNLIERFRQTEISQIGISSITLSQLLYGVSKSSKPEQNKIALMQFVAPLQILPYDHEAAQYYGGLRTRCRSVHMLCGLRHRLLSQQNHAELLILAISFWILVVPSSQELIFPEPSSSKRRRIFEN